MTTTVILVSLIVIGLSVSYFMRKTKSETIVEDQVETADAFVHANETFTEVEEKVDEIKESIEETVNRLKHLENPDKDKPFAKISAPEINEVSDEIELKEVKPKAKRKYKKKTKEIKIEK